MEDEKYLFHSTSWERKNVARSARNKRTHTGKGGRVRLPSDYKTKKELNKMNGYVTVFNLKKPMVWGYFKLMPDDLKKEYLESIMERFGVSVREISEMLGIHFTQLYKVINTCGVDKRKINPIKDMDGFNNWVNGGTFRKDEESPVKDNWVEEAFEEISAVEQEECSIPEYKSPCYPESGSMVFEGRCEDALRAVSLLLGGAKVHINIMWDVLED